MSSILPGCAQIRAEQKIPKEPVLFFSGGTIDDSVSYILLTTMEIDLKGVVVTNTDSIAGPAMEVQWKISNYLQDAARPQALSAARGWNPFPWLYRADCIRFNQVEALASCKPNPNWPPYPSGEALTQSVLEQAVAAGNPVTVLATCPVTGLTDVLAQDPGLEKGIRRIIFMGGAVRVPGNLDPNTLPKEIANNKAEWNVFWDPYAVDWLLQNTRVPIFLFPLDVTNQAKVGPLMPRLKEQSREYRYSRLVHQGYLLTDGQPFYCMWNVLATSYLARPDLFDLPTPVKLKVVTEGYEQGSLLEDANGREVQAVLNMADCDGFYDYVLRELRR